MNKVLQDTDPEKTDKETEVATERDSVTPEKENRDIASPAIDEMAVALGDDKDVAGDKLAEPSPEEGDQDRRYEQRGDRRGGGRGHGRRDGRPMTNEEKLRMYKKQSEERLLDIKRSRENKIGKKRK